MNAYTIAADTIAPEEETASTADNAPQPFAPMPAIAARAIHSPDDTAAAALSYGSGTTTATAPTPTHPYGPTVPAPAENGPRAYMAERIGRYLARERRARVSLIAAHARHITPDAAA